MDLDFLVFPSPKCKYNKQTLGDELIFVPKYKKSLVKINQKIKKPLQFNRSLDLYNNQNNISNTKPVYSY